MQRVVIVVLDGFGAGAMPDAHAYGDDGADTLISGESITDIAIENLLLDGNRTSNLNLDGNGAGCIWLQDCSRVRIRGVTACNDNGDGISGQICHDVTVENGLSENHAGPRNRLK